MSIEKGHKPTKEQLEEGPVVKLDGRGRWDNRSWSPHGLAYNINFDADGQAEILKEHFDAWINIDAAEYDGIRVAK